MDPDLDHFEKIARETVAALPAPFRAAAQAVQLRCAEWPGQEMLDDLNISDPLELTGLYSGIPMTEKSFDDMPSSPDMVWLFRQSILAEWHDREDEELDALIAHVVVHEFAHHFGWSDAQIAAIDEWWT